MRLRTALTALLLSGTALAATPEFERAQTLREEAAAAIEAGDLAKADAALTEALAIRTHHAGIVLALATVKARLGQNAAALDLLEDFAAMGLTADIASSDDFLTLHQEPRFAAVLARLEANAKPVGALATGYTFGDGRALFEAVVVDEATGRAFAGSIRQRRIVVVENGVARDFVTSGQDGLMSVFGLAIDAERGLLWAASSTIVQTEGAGEAERGAVGVFAFDLQTGALKRKAVLPPDGKALFGDLTLAPDGTVYVSDSANPVIWRLLPDATELEPFVTDIQFVSLEGLTFSADGTKLAVADYAMGLFVIDVASRTAKLLAPPAGVTLRGIDELTGDGPLIATQNGINPQRVARITLNADWSAVTAFEVLAANLPQHDEITLGEISGDDFVYIANSQWSRFGNDGAIEGDRPFAETVAVKLRLR